MMDIIAEAFGCLVIIGGIGGLTALGCYILRREEEKNKK